MEIPESTEAKVGDIFDLYYSVSGWWTKGKVESLVYRIDQDPRWKITRYDYDEPNDKLRLRVEIVANPFPIVVVVAAIGVAAAGLFAWLSLDKIEKITTSPVGAAMGLGTVAAAVLGMWALVGKR